MKKLITTSIEALLAARAACVERIAEIDGILRERGVRPIQQVVGRPRAVAASICVLLEGGPLTAPELARRTGKSTHAMHQMLSKMTLAGELVRVGRGRYELPVRG